MIGMTGRVHTHKERHSTLWRFHIDTPLLMGLLVLMALGLLIVYSAGGNEKVLRQALRFALGLSFLVAIAQMPPRSLRMWSPVLYALGVVLLVVVDVVGVIGKGAQRWLDLGFIRFQPSELMKVAVPMMLAWYFTERPLPPRTRHLAVAVLIVLVPTALTALQPDLGTALLIAAAGFFVLWFAGLSWRLVVGLAAAAVPIGWALWHFYMHDYQKQRVLTFLNPESDPLGTGYHIIQSKIAIGSGGWYGKGYLQGSQSQLEFVPERSTDFIFAVFGEEFGLLGVLAMLLIYGFILARGLTIAIQAQETYSRLLAGALTMSFFVYVFVNMGMVSGLLPVVGVPLPLVSYGGTVSVTLLAGFGMLMSVHTHRKLLSS